MRYRLLYLAAILISCQIARADSDVLAKAPSHFATLKGTPDLKIHYKFLPAEQDEMLPALVFVHGWCCDMSVWEKQAAAFNNKARMIFIDLPGYGKSDHPRIEYSMDLFAKAINAVMEDAKVNSTTLIGHSMGTPVVRQFYRLYPAKTKALIVVDGSLRPFSNDREQLEKWVSRFKEETFKEEAPKMLQSMIPESNTALREHIQRLVENTTPQAAISSQRAMIDESIWKDDPIKVPTQAIMAQSPFWTDDYKDYVKKLVPNLDYREYQGVGHFLFMEKPDEINAAMMEFLKKNNLM